MNSFPVMLCAVLVGAVAPVSAQTDRKVAVVPFAALSGEVPPRAGAKAAGMLATEIKNADGAQLVEGKKPGTDATKPDRAQKVRSLAEEAKALRQQRKFGKAEDALNQAVTEVRQGAALEPADLADLFALLSAVQYVTGRDDEGLRSLKAALTVNPGHELALAKTSPLFQKQAEQTRAALNAGPKGVLGVDSLPRGASVWVDGNSVGRTPLTLREVPAGVHHWKVQLPGGEPHSGLVEVEPQKTAQVSAQSTNQDPEGKLAAVLAQNRLDDQALGAAASFGKAAQASHVVFGALSVEGRNLGLDAFVLATASGELKRLPHASFDPELLSAGVEMLKLAGALQKNGGEAVKVPTAVNAEAGTPTGKPVEVKYGSVAVDVGATEPATAPTENPRAPLDGGRRPLSLPKRR